MRSSRRTLYSDFLSVVLIASGHQPGLADPAVRFDADGGMFRLEGYRQWVFTEFYPVFKTARPW